MAFLLGIIVFAFGIAISVALHEAGHMVTARAFGMRVRRYFIGFGPPLWQTTRGHTTYGVAALPFGGFCDIAGLTSQDLLTEEEKPLAMYLKPWWQRVAVMSGGILMNLLLGLVITYLVAVFAAIPNPYADRTPTVGAVSCTADQTGPDTLADCTGPGPAGEAGVHPGDKVLAVDGASVATFDELRSYVLVRPGQTVTLTVGRDGQELDIPIVVDEVVRLNAQTGESIRAGAIGVASQPVEDPMASFGPVEAVPATVSLTGQMLRGTVEGLIAFPGKIPGVVASIFGAERDVAGPVSVIGASRAGGELVERDMWAVFWMLLASLNFFLALFNIVPLPPLDGGHIAVIFFETLRDALRRLRGLPPGGPVNYDRLMPVTYAMAAALLVVGMFVMVADVVNPVRIFG
ncbi:M50 family metallopeptidase [Corynebacterium timonense]|uniref:Zinc metalloprotease Rip1 n=1 Tax=Corynebacterium timonense TaxID=441500 RepID=A0A1H1N1A5_9CORY|nr:M50 family metallopeptidase [Corynebacterium timonense]SDR92690.1 RIP metalloprotease RseP [Corynebacterium timonense]